MSAIRVEFTRLPLTSPCPVAVTADGATFDADGEPLPMEQRPELCAVDAGWMIGSQRVCDYHLRELFDRGLLDGIGTYDDLCRDIFGEYGQEAVDKAIRRSLVPWGDRRRYSQHEARDWHESAKEHGLA